jgi:hypothetical protein
MLLAAGTQQEAGAMLTEQKIHTVATAYRHCSGSSPLQLREEVLRLIYLAM